MEVAIVATFAAVGVEPKRGGAADAFTAKTANRAESAAHVNDRTRALRRCVTTSGEVGEAGRKEPGGALDEMRTHLFAASLCSLNRLGMVP